MVTVFLLNDTVQDDLYAITEDTVRCKRYLLDQKRADSFWNRLIKAFQPTVFDQARAHSSDQILQKEILWV